MASFHRHWKPPPWKRSTTVAADAPAAAPPAAGSRRPHEPGTDRLEFGAGSPAAERGFWRSLPRQLYDEWFRIEVSALASQVAYSLIFAVPSLLLLVMTVAAIVDRSTHGDVQGRLQREIGRQAPPQLEPLLQYVVEDAVARVDNGSISIAIGVALGVALWSGSAGVSVLINACHRAHGIRNTRSFVRNRLVALQLTVVLSLLSVSSSVLFLGGQRLGELISDWFDLGDTFDAAYRAAQWPVGVAVIALAMVILYRLGPVSHPPYRWIIPGVALGTAGWLGLVAGFRLYLRLADPGTSYGAVGTFIALLVFFYLTGIVFVLGAEVNGILARRYVPAGMASAPDPQSAPRHEMGDTQRSSRLLTPERRSGARCGPRARSRRSRPTARRRVVVSTR